MVGVKFVATRLTTLGSLAMMPTMIIRLMPLPIPYSSICSPIHIMNMVPVVMSRAASNVSPGPKLAGIAPPAPLPWARIVPIMMMPCTMQRATVAYRVYWLIFCLPASPSFLSRSRAGTTLPSNWNMIEALM